MNKGSRLRSTVKRARAMLHFIGHKLALVDAEGPVLTAIINEHFRAPRS